MDLKGRILEFIEYKRLDKATFERIVGLSNDAVSKMGDNTRISTIDKISNVFPELNTVWLRTGEGEMLIKNNISRKKLYEVTDDVRPSIAVSENIPVYEKKTTGVLLIENSFATCGIPDGFSVAAKKEECTTIEVPGFHNVDFAIRAKGDSMINRDNPSRSICQGDIVGLRKCTTRSHIQWGEVYALATIDGVVIKKLLPSEKEGYIKCISFNTEDNYLPYDLPLNEVSDWAIVVGVVGVNMW